MNNGIADFPIAISIISKEPTPAFMNRIYQGRDLKVSLSGKVQFSSLCSCSTLRAKSYTIPVAMGQRTIPSRLWGIHIMCGGWRVSPIKSRKTESIRKILQDKRLDKISIKCSQSPVYAISNRAELSIIDHFGSLKAFEEEILGPHYPRLLLSLLDASQQRMESLVFPIFTAHSSHWMDFGAVPAASPWLLIDLN